MEPKLSHDQALTRWIYLIMRAFRIYRWTTSLDGHPLLILDQTHWLTPSLWMFAVIQTIPFHPCLHCSAPVMAVAPMKPVLLHIFVDHSEKALSPRRQDRGRNIWTAPAREIPLLFSLASFFTLHRYQKNGIGRIHIYFFVKYIQTLIIPLGDSLSWIMLCSSPRNK